MHRAERLALLALVIGVASARHADAQAHRVKIDQLPLGAGHTIEIGASDSNSVMVTVDGGKYPLIAHASAEAARRWAARADSIAGAPPGAQKGTKAEASERNEFSHNSDVFRYQRFDSASPPRNVLGIDIGPRNLVVYSTQVSPGVLGRVVASMRRAASVTDSLTPASKRCFLQRDLAPLDNSGPDGFAPGTNLDRIDQPALQRGSPVPGYPKQAKGARVVGTVVTSFAIDTAGRPVIETFRLVREANALFVQAVCDVLPRMRFVPSVVNGRPVRRLVKNSFVLMPQ